MDEAPLGPHSGARPPIEKMASTKAANRGTSRKGNPNDPSSSIDIITPSTSKNTENSIIKLPDQLHRSEKDDMSKRDPKSSTISSALNSVKNNQLESVFGSTSSISSLLTSHSQNAAYDHANDYDKSMDQDIEIDDLSEVAFTPVKNKKVKRDFGGKIVNPHLSRKHQLKDDAADEHTNNRFAILGDIDIEVDNEVIEKDIARNTSTTNNTNNVTNNRNKTNIKSSTRKSFCPPIFMRNVNIKSLVNTLNMKSVTFKIKNKSGGKSKLYLNDASIHSEMMQLLREKGFDSYSYTPKELKRQSVVCRGIYHRTDINDIKEYIDGIAPGIVEKVTKFSTDYSRKKGFDTGLFLITLKVGADLCSLTNIKEILNQIVTFERPNMNLKIPQCWRCQQWGHFSKNCNRPFACVKCDVSHAPGDCKFVSDDEVKPFCVNCKKRGHPSNFTGCPAFVKYCTIRNKQVQESKSRATLASTNVSQAIQHRNSGQTFASLFKDTDRTPTQVASQKPALITEFLNIAKQILQPEVTSLERRIENFIRNYKSIAMDEARLECINLLKEIEKTYGP